MMRVQSETVIRRPVDAVFSFIANVRNQTIWVPAVAEVRSPSDASIGVGTNFVQVVQFLGRRFEANFQVTEYEENRIMSFQSTSGHWRCKSSRRSTLMGSKPTLILCCRVSRIASLMSPGLCYNA